MKILNNSLIGPMKRLMQAFSISLACCALAACAGAPSSEEASSMGEAHYKIGVAHLQKNDLQNALVEFQKGLISKPGDKRLHFALAQTYDGQERQEEAIKALKEAIRIDTSYSEARNYLGGIYSKMLRYEEALEEFNKALTNPLYSTPQLVHFNMGLTWLAMGRHEDALRKFQESTRIDPSFLPGYVNRGQLASRMGRYQDAAQAFREALSVAPGALDIRMELAVALYNDHQDAMAVQEFKTVVQQDKEGGWAASARNYLKALEK